jgi:arylformamidase
MAAEPLARRTSWRQMPAAELERQFNPRASLPDFQRHIDDYRRLSAAARPRLAGQLDLRYGEGPLQTLDVYGARPGKLPTVIFFHGGYWRSLDKHDVAFALEALVGAGARAVNVNYDLCPAVTLDRVVAEAREAVAFVWREAERLGADRERLYLAGHSAGGHLAMMCLNTDWTQGGLPAEPFKGALALSGVFELEPVLHISVNDDVRLDAAMARRNSPLLHPPRWKLPLLLAAGEEEPEGWIQQSADFHAACRAQGNAAEFLRLAGKNHFSILGVMAESRHPVTRSWLRIMGL